MCFPSCVHTHVAMRCDTHVRCRVLCSRIAKERLRKQGQTWRRRMYAEQDQENAARQHLKFSKEMVESHNKELDGLLKSF
jgi:hypothetical protein